MRGPTVFEAGDIPPPEGDGSMSSGRPAAQGLIGPSTSTTRAALRSSRGSTRSRCTRPCGGRSRHSPTSSIAAPRAPIRARVTAQASCCRSRCVLPRRRRGGAAGAGPLRRRDVLLPHGRSAARPRAAARGDLEAGPDRRLLARRSGRSGVAGPHGGVVRTTRPAARRQRPGRARRPGGVRAKLYVIRRRFELEGGADAIIPSFSSRTIVYKGMLTAPQLRGYYPDLQDERTASALALVHSRFSTNTFPSWALAHPYRMIAHNGEINTVRGNINWMRARESQLASELSATTSTRCCRSSRRAGRTRPCSTTCSSCSCSAAARCRTR